MNVYIEMYDRRTGERIGERKQIVELFDYSNNELFRLAMKMMINYSHKYQISKRNMEEYIFDMDKEEIILTRAQIDF